MIMQLDTLFFIMNGKGVLFMEQIISLVIAPLLVGLIITLVDHWLDD
ncbi:type I toxin-antitoxin system Fst family toxin [Enterococcus gallinarum]|nr:type I toxin-antitoxin system Fst family toxin [Enterococcus gallinarum]